MLFDGDTQFALHNLRRLVGMLINICLVNIEIPVGMTRERQKGIRISTYSVTFIKVWLSGLLQISWHDDACFAVGSVLATP
jgi:hypothetical protein